MGDHLGVVDIQGLEDSPPRLATVLQSACRGQTAEAAGACQAHPFIMKKLLVELQAQEERARAAPEMEHGLPAGSDLEPLIRSLSSTLLQGVAREVVGFLGGAQHFGGRSSHTIQGTKTVCQAVVTQLEVLRAELGALGPQLNDYLKWGEVATTVGATKTGKEKKTFSLTCTLLARVSSAAAAAVEQCKHRAAMLRLVLAAAAAAPLAATEQPAEQPAAAQQPVAAAEQPAAAAQKPATEQGAAAAAGVSCAAQPVAKARLPFGAHNPPSRPAGVQQASAGQKRAPKEEESSENVDPEFVTPPQPAEQQAPKRARQMLAMAQQQHGSGVSRMLR